MANPKQSGLNELRLLIIEDSEDDALLLLQRFRDAGYACVSQRVDNAKDMSSALRERRWDVVLSDHSMPRFDATSALHLLQESNLDLPIIIVSGVIDEETAIAAMREGAHDYLSKNNLDRLVPAVERELREARNRSERRVALQALKENEARFRALVSNLPGMVFQMARSGPKQEFRFLYVSEGSAAVLGVQPDELIAVPGIFLEMIHHADRDGFIDAMQESAATSSAVNWDGRIVVPGGDTKWINLRSSPRHRDGRDAQWEGVVFNITQSKLTEFELRNSRAQLAELSSHLQAVKEDERERIARDIHDELGGNLVAIKFEVALLAGKLDSDLLLLRRRVRSIGELVDDAIATAGRVARELRPGILKDFGLAAAVECQAEDFTQRTGVPCSVLCADYDATADEAASTALFRIFQEALTNISKHAHASKVTVRLVQEGGDILLEISDDGRGVTQEALSKPRSYGLRGMRERLNALHGSLDIGRAPNGGTRLTVRIPASGADVPTAGTGNSVVDTPA
jgi:two-component system, NarL family, sensor histidine kinase UhpB